MKDYFQCLTFMLLGIGSIQAQLEDRTISFDFVTGYSLVNGNLSSGGFPFGLSDHGPGWILGGQYLIRERLGIAFHSGFSFQPYRHESAGLVLLDQDPLARSVSITASHIRILSFSPGIFYNYSPFAGWYLQFSASGGVSIIRTPELLINMDSEPLTQFKYNSGSTSALHFSFAIKPYRIINEKFSVGLTFQYLNSSPVIRITDADQLQVSQDLSFHQFVIGVGMSYHIRHQKNSQTIQK